MCVANGCARAQSHALQHSYETVFISWAFVKLYFIDPHAQFTQLDGIHKVHEKIVNEIKTVRCCVCVLCRLNRRHARSTCGSLKCRFICSLSSKLFFVMGKWYAFFKIDFYFIYCFSSPKSHVSTRSQFIPWQSRTTTFANSINCNCLWLNHG